MGRRGWRAAAGAGGGGGAVAFCFVPLDSPLNTPHVAGRHVPGVRKDVPVIIRQLGAGRRPGRARGEGLQGRQGDHVVQRARPVTRGAGLLAAKQAEEAHGCRSVCVFRRVPVCVGPGVREEPAAAGQRRVEEKKGGELERRNAASCTPPFFFSHAPPRTHPSPQPHHADDHPARQPVYRPPDPVRCDRPPGGARPRGLAVGRARSPRRARRSVGVRFEIFFCVACPRLLPLMAHPRHAGYVEHVTQPNPGWAGRRLGARRRGRAAPAKLRARHGADFSSALVFSSLFLSHRLHALPHTLQPARPGRDPPGGRLGRQRDCAGQALPH